MAQVRIVNASYLRPLNPDIEEDIYRSLWYYVSGSLKETRALIKKESDTCPRSYDVRDWMDMLDLNTVGLAKLLGVRRTSVANNYLLDIADTKIGITAPRLLRAALLTGYFKRHPEAPQYFSAMSMLNDMVQSGEFDDIWITVAEAKAKGMKPSYVDRMRAEALANLRPHEVVSVDDEEYQEWLAVKQMKLRAKPARDIYALKVGDLQKMERDYTRTVFIDKNFSGVVMSGMFNESVFINCVFDNTKFTGNFVDTEFYSCRGTGTFMNGLFDRTLMVNTTFDVEELKGSFTFIRMRNSYFGQPAGIQASTAQFAGGEGIRSYVDVPLPEHRKISGRAELAQWIDIFPDAKFWAHNTEPGTPMGDALHDRYFE